MVLIRHAFAAGGLHATGPLQLFETSQALLVCRLRPGLLGTCGHTSLQVSMPFRKKRLRAGLNQPHAAVAAHAGL